MLSFPIVLLTCFLIGSSIACKSTERPNSAYIAKKYMGANNARPLLADCHFDVEADDEFDKISECMVSNLYFNQKMEVRNVTNNNVPSITRQCQNDPNYQPSYEAMSALSLSPWKWVKNIDENRIPREIPEAECLCDYCIDPRNGQQIYDYESKPIYTKLWSNPQKVQVGCECVLHSSH